LNQTRSELNSDYSDRLLADAREKAASARRKIAQALPH
jgi:hypothetical protein